MTAHHRTAEWSRTTRAIRPRIEASLPAACIDCSRPIFPGDRWQVGHIISVAHATAAGWSVAQMNASTNLGPSHTKARGQKACNQIAGGKIGAAMTNKKRNESRGHPSRW